jgi:SAM-dependent methyltransferase
MGYGLPGVLRLLPSPTLAVRDRIADTLKILAPDAKILDVGAGGRRIVPQITTCDMFHGSDTDIVGDIHALPIADNSYDCVFCTGTLEHVERPWDAVEELLRVLKPGGVVHIDVPFMQGYHADPTDYWRFTLDGLRLLCKDFTELESGVQIGPSCGVTWIVREWAHSLTTNRIACNALLFATAVAMWPIKFVDYFATRSSRAHYVASAVFFRGRKAD